MYASMVTRSESYIDENNTVFKLEGTKRQVEVMKFSWHRGPGCRVGRVESSWTQR